MSAYSSLEQVVLSDFKQFEAGGGRFGIGQVEVVGFHEFHNLKGELAAQLERLRQQRDLALTGLLVTDIVAGDSLLLVSHDSTLPFAMGYPQLEEGLYELKGVLSRKKQLLPHLLKVLAPPA
jgi:manganese-dependent inorganic pyrophosphatase